MPVTHGPEPVESRTLTARSVLASTLLGVSPPELSARALVATAELLGIAAGTARVAMSRMVSAGELEVTDRRYRLVAPELLARQARQDLSRRGADPSWNGSWRTAIVVRDDRTAAERTALRSSLTALRFGELREGVWVRPANLPEGVLPEAEAVVAAQCAFVIGTLDVPIDPSDLAGSLWDLDGWQDRAASVLNDLERIGPRLAVDDHEALAEGFVISADALRHLQADPLLPVELLPADWPGDRLRETHRRYDQAFKSTLASWQRGGHQSTAST